MNTTKKILIAGAVVIVVALIAVLAFVFFMRSGNVPAPVATTNPFGTSSGNIPTPAGTGETGLLIILDNGTTVRVPDFTKNNQPDWASPTAGYQVAGSVSSDFLITYILPDPITKHPQFLVTLLAEPLGQVRLAAEQALRSALGLSNSELCQLDTVVSAGPGVNEAYSGKRLGLSFCPGAVLLPN